MPTNWRDRRSQAACAQEPPRVDFPQVDVSRLPPGPLDRPRWGTAFAASALPGGGAGVVLVATRAGGYALKAPARPAEEYFGALVLRRLGVRTPEVRAVSRADPEWEEIRGAVRSAADASEKRGDAAGAEKLMQHLEGSLSRSQLLVMGLVQHSAPLGSDPRAAKFLSAYGDDSVARATAAEHSAGRVGAELQMLGRCLASDVLINNAGRLVAPCWGNPDGNCGNLLLAGASSRLGPTASVAEKTLDARQYHIVAIASVSNCCKADGAEFQGYLARARDFLNTICDDTTTATALEDFCYFLNKSAGVKLTSAALHEVRAGVLQVLAEVAAVSDGEDAGTPDFPHWVDALCLRVQDAAINEGREQEWGQSAGSIDRGFLKHMVAMFRDVARQHQASLPAPSAPPSWPRARRSVRAGSPAPPDRPPDVPAELLQALPVDIQNELLCAQGEPFRVLMVQERPRRQADAARLIDGALRADRGSAGRAAGLVLLPEGFVAERLETDVRPLLPDRLGNAPPAGGEAPRELGSYAEVARAHGVYIVCGTMCEPAGGAPGRFYTTSVVLGPDGRGVGAYRKRRVHDHRVQAAGDRPLVFGVPGLGRAGLLICLDAEDAGLRGEAVDLGVRCLLNPIHIPAGGAGPGWQAAVDAVSEDLGHLCNAHGVTWLRCDLPSPHGLGSSQAIGPEQSHRAASPGPGVLPALVPPPPGPGRAPLLGRTPGSSRPRSRREQNCGPRCVVSSVVLEGEVAQLGFLRPGGCAAGTGKRLCAALADQSVAVLGGLPALAVETTAAPGTAAHAGIRAGATPVAGEGGLLRGVTGRGGWLDPDATVWLQLTGLGELELVRRGSDGNMCRPVAIPTAERFKLVLADSQDGTFATLSHSQGPSSKVSFWSFSHNCIPAPLPSFLSV